MALSHRKWGYGESKFVAERVLDTAAKEADSYFYWYLSRWSDRRPDYGSRDVAETGVAAESNRELKSHWKATGVTGPDGDGRLDPNGRAWPGNRRANGKFDPQHADNWWRYGLHAVNVKILDFYEVCRARAQVRCS